MDTIFNTAFEILEILFFEKQHQNPYCFRNHVSSLSSWPCPVEFYISSKASLKPSDYCLLPNSTINIH